MIDALDLPGIAAALDAQQVAAMGAAVDKGVDLAVIAAGHDDCGLADRRRDPIARIRDLGGEAQIAPGRPLEDPLLLQPVLLGIGVEPERDLGKPVRRPRHAPNFLGAHARTSRLLLLAQIARTIAPAAGSGTAAQNRVIPGRPRAEPGTHAHGPQRLVASDRAIRSKPVFIGSGLAAAPSRNNHSVGLREFACGNRPDRRRALLITGRQLAPGGKPNRPGEGSSRVGRPAVGGGGPESSATRS